MEGPETRQCGSNMSGATGVLYMGKKACLGAADLQRRMCHLLPSTAS